MPTFKISGQRFALDAGDVVECVGRLLPDPVREHYVIVNGRRFPPKQVLCCVTGLDRADFTTHQARRVLMRLGFTAARVGAAPAEAHDGAAGARGPFRGRQAAALADYLGKWVALSSPTEVLVAADTPQEVLEWLARHERKAYGMFRVPVSETEAQGVAPL